MHKPIWLLLLAIVSLSADAASQPRHLVEANQLVDNILPQFNVYQHRDCFVRWKGVDGAPRYENRTDCSDLLEQLVKHTYGVTPSELRQWTGHRRPLADEWHDAIVTESGFTRIRKITDAQPGDVLAVKFPKGLGDTGHVMLLAAAPQTIKAETPIVAGTTQWIVTVIDSTRSPHGAPDTRMLPDGTQGQGAGRGNIRIYIDPNGEVAGYTWSDSGKSKFQPQTERHMAIGRLNVASE